MANVDLETKKIRGAEKGTLRYYHEEGHLKFEEESKKGNFTRVMQELSFRTLIFSIALYILFPNKIIYSIILLSLLLNINSEFYEESWCWGYARNKLKKVHKGYGFHKKPKEV